MKEHLRRWAFKTLLIIGPLAHGQTPIWIDPGHGGSDPGTVSLAGVPEKELVLDIALWMAESAKNGLDIGYPILLTRYRDTLISLTDRGLLPKMVWAKAIVSIHMNHSPNPLAKGIEVHIHRRGGPSERLAQKLVADLVVKLGMESRGIRTGDFQILREAPKDIPVLLVELGFLSHPEESRFLSTPLARKALAMILMEGLRDFFDNHNSMERKTYR
ncbi:N-acetylmuramoyl-L-alanine amidase family protein [Sediminicola luteus]|uniref:N-acetylmuramoyl-L-alanine amidase n=1 Tax=Sediminicola luteus TaxID=319238 RepID=A0A2A4G5J0_9FLAO|nr:N-acetylmuramoyl-L-alanine amidase [Sediminicola luteus]PCE63012.1 hypothetical protein B7P33_17210 [Sediminicola luteus]